MFKLGLLLALACIAVVPPGLAKDNKTSVAEPAVAYNCTSDAGCATCSSVTSCTACKSGFKLDAAAGANACALEGVSLLPTTTKPSGPAPAGPAPRNGQCFDRLSWCPSWAAYCGDEWWYNGQRVGSYWCPVTCRRCSGGGGGSTDWRRQLLDLVNNARRQNGMAALCLNSKLNTAAQRHSDDMVNRNFFSHTGSDGSSPFVRMQRAGYSYSWAGENIAMGQRSAQDVFNSWWNSAGHRANILNRNYQHMGAGMNSNRWTQTFGASRSEGCA